MWITVDFRDEGCAERVNGESTRHFQRFARRNVRIDFRVGNIRGKSDARTGHGPRRVVLLTGSPIDKPVPRMKNARAAALQVPALSSDGCRVRLAVDDAIKFEHGVPAEHESVGYAVGDRLGFHAREQQDRL